MYQSDLKKSGETVNCLRLSEAETSDILALLSRGDSTNPAKERRKQERLPYGHRAGLIVKMHHPGGSIGNYLVCVRNLSSKGIGFLHGSFVYTGTRCTMALRSRDNRVVNIEGKVVRCNHVRKHIHEIGLIFQEPIRVGEFVESALRMGAGLETGKELPHLSGLVMYVEDSISDQELVAFHLGNIGVKVKTVSNVLAAVELAGQIKFDAVLANVWLPAMSGLELADFLRQGGYKGPIIALTADDRPEVREDARKHGCTTLLVKPYHFEELFAILEPHLQHTQTGDANETIMSELWGDERMQPLIRAFLNRLKGEIVELQRQIDGGKGGASLRKLCLDVKGSAGGYGFPKISEAAQSVLELVMEEVEGAPLVAACTELSNLCRSACSLLEKVATVAPAPSTAPVPVPAKAELLRKKAG